MKKVLNRIVVFNTFFSLKCSAFGSMPNGVASTGFLVSLLKRNWGIRLGCMINKSFCGVPFLAKKDD